MLNKVDQNDAAEAKKAQAAALKAHGAAHAASAGARVLEQRIDGYTAAVSGQAKTLADLDGLEAAALRRLPARRG